MLSKLLNGMLLLALVLSPTIATGQKVPAGKWWQVPRLADELNLTDEQKQQLDELHLNNRRRLIELKSNVERERLELGNLLESQTLDEVAVVRQFEKLENARTTMATERFRYFIQVRKTIGYDRFQRLKTVFREIRRERGRQESDRFGDQRGDRQDRPNKWRRNNRNW